MTDFKGRLRLGLFAMGVLIIGGALQTAQADESRRVKFFGALDVFLLNEGPEDGTADRAEQYVASGYDSASYDVDEKAGLGARFGFLVPQNGWDLGASLGYVRQSVDSTINLTSGFAGNGTVTREKRRLRPPPR